MKYVIQKAVQKKAWHWKDVSTHDSILAATEILRGMGLRYEGTSYIGCWPQYSDGQGGLWRIILIHPTGLVCSPSKVDLQTASFGLVKA